MSFKDKIWRSEKQGGEITDSKKPPSRGETMCKGRKTMKTASSSLYMEIGSRVRNDRRWG